jgi:hypothetical protein
MGVRTNKWLKIKTEVDCKTVIAGILLDAENIFQEEALRQFSNCFIGKSTSACWGLLYVANKNYLNQ